MTRDEIIEDENLGAPLQISSVRFDPRHPAPPVMRMRMDRLWSRANFGARFLQMRIAADHAFAVPAFDGEASDLVERREGDLAEIGEGARGVEQDRSGVVGPSGLTSGSG